MIGSEYSSIDPGVGFFMVFSIGTSGGKHAHTPLVFVERFLVDHCPFLIAGKQWHCSLVARQHLC